MPSRQTLVLIPLLLLQTALMAGLLWVVRDRVFIGANDFLSFYAGAQLVGTPDLYDHDRVKQIQAEEIGIPSDTLPFIRPPFYAAMLWPLGKLPYMTAYVVWQSLNLAALVGFVLLFPGSSRRKTFVFTWCSIPVFWSMVNAQDLPLLLLWIATAAVLRDRNKPVAAGITLSLCATKAHLFLLLPLMVFHREGRRVLAGLAAGGAVLTLVSFAVAGPGWVVEFFNINLHGNLQPTAYTPPNLLNLLSLLPGGESAFWLFAGMVVSGTGWIIWRSRLPVGFAAVLFGSLLLTPHLFIQDYALVLPAAMTISSTAISPILNRLAVLLLTPVLYLLELAATWPAGAALPTALLVSLAFMWSETRRGDAPPGTMRTGSQA